MGVNITLRNIKDRWNPASVRYDRDFLLRVFPDCYSCKVCQNYRFFFEPVSEEDRKRGAQKGMSDSTIGALFRGNRLTRKDVKPTAPRFTEDLIVGLIKNPLLTFRDKAHHPEDSPSSYFRGNMFNKILSAVNEMGAPTSGAHPLFIDLRFSDVWKGTSVETAEEFRKVGEAVDALLEKPSDITVSYAIMLLIVLSVVQDRIKDVSFLYKPESLEKVYAYKDGEKLIDVPSEKVRPFYDPYYFNHTYYVYKFREASGRLWKECMFRMEREANERPVATLAFTDGITSPIAGNDEIKRVYSGTPMYSPADEMIYIAMTDKEHTFLMLAMSYHKFKAAPMYFRTGYILKASSIHAIPKTHKIAITAKPVDPEDIPYMEGLLKMDSDQLYLSDHQYTNFLKRFEKYSWMQDFRENYVPIFEVHNISGIYHLNADEIISCSRSTLERHDRIRILLALKSMDAPGNPDLFKYSLCKNPKETHKIFKYGAASDSESDMIK